MLRRTSTGSGAAIRSAVCTHRSSGELTTSTTGSDAAARRSPTPSACTSPVASRKTPGIQPASVPLVLADERPWRTKITVGTPPP